jgi:hypothetical protein
MTTQLFKTPVPPSVLFDVLEQICLKTEKYYLIDINAYKKLVFYKLHESFSTTIAEYYYNSKKFYATREMTYNSFINVVRHICKNAKIPYTSQLKYNESVYNINYMVYHQ